jgi:D-threo-aldose 1-dehydrogenase
VQISKKLGWYRIPLTTPEPTFETGAWVDLKNDAVQKISYDGILQCWDQGCKLLGEEFAPDLVSVHDPDEYLKCKDRRERQKRFTDILQAYKALSDLKAQGLTKSVGVGAKDWHSIVEVSREIELDWVMFSVSFTIFSHPAELLDFIAELAEKGVMIINSAVFHAGFLTGGNYFDYRLLDDKNKEDRPYFSWRDEFFILCKKHDVSPAEACVQFAMSPPAVKSIALNTSRPERVLPNIRSVSAHIPADFWIAMKDAGLIAKSYPYVG